jgi:hypothetical protein
MVITTGSLAAADDAPCIAPSADQPGVHRPTGSDASTFVYQCDGTYAGLYYNGYYTYDPATGARNATYAPNYSYNCTAQKWTMDDYEYSPGQQTFVKSRVKASPAPNLPTNCPVVTPPANTSPSGSASPNGSVSNTGNGSQNNVNTSGTLNSNTANSNNIGMNNTINSTAGSGNAFVLDNTFGGSATSGDTSAAATVINLLQSSSNVLGDNVATFTANINGDVNGDFMFDPSATMANTGNGSQNGVNNNLQVNTNTSNDTNAQINNDINVSAASGDANVNGNTNAGSATSGDASAIVNLMNLINSTVAAGQSFVGTININGNLNGDILLPQNFIDQLLAASGAGSSTTATNTVANTSNTTNDFTSAISNNLNSSATTGDANVSGNTSAGSATSGNAKTGVTLLNLTGSNVVGANDLLVFVNVLGTWVGMIVNAPAGSTAAELGGGITSTGANSANTTNNSLTTDTTTNNTNNFGINNNVNVSAASGDANVRNNTKAGDAASGDANTAVNILNMTGSNLSLSNWFGVLFINVFGNWSGSFGINTSAGDTQTASPAPANTTAPETSTSAASSAGQFASFLAHTSHHTSSDASYGTTSEDSGSGSVLGTSTAAAVHKVSDQAAKVAPTPDNASHASFVLPIIGFCAAAILLFISERGRFFGKK